MLGGMLHRRLWWLGLWWWRWRQEVFTPDFGTVFGGSSSSTRTWQLWCDAVWSMRRRGGSACLLMCSSGTAFSCRVALDTMLQLVSQPLRPGGRQPYNGCPFGGGGCRPFPHSSFQFFVSSHVVVAAVLKLKVMGLHCGLVFFTCLLTCVYDTLVNHIMDLYFLLVQQS